MTEIWSVLGLGLLTTAAALFLRQIKPEFSLLVSAAGCVLIALLLMNGISTIKSSLSSILNEKVINSSVLSVVFKSMGICYLTSFASNICKDYGQTALSGNIETAGKITVLILSFPLIKEITDTAVELIG